MRITIYAFRKGQSDKYRKDQGIIFHINGQVHGVISQSLYNRNTVNMGYLADSILVSIDASEIDGRTREDLFMNSRDRIRRGDVYTKIEESLEELLRNHQGLRELRERRRRETIENKLTNSRPLRETLGEIIKNSPALSALLREGGDIGNPLKFKSVGGQEIFNGKIYPSYFKIISRDVDRTCELGRRFRVQFETDVANDYFDRDADPGRFELFVGDELVSDYTITLWNGMATLLVKLPDRVHEGDTLYYSVSVEDDSMVEPIQNAFTRHVVPFVLSEGKPGERRKPAGSLPGDERTISAGLDLPEVVEVRQDEWSEHGFDKYSALKVISYAQSYDFFVNMDNAYLKAELKKRVNTNDDAALFEAQFKFALVLTALALLKMLSESSDENSVESPEEKMLEISKALAPVLIPIINDLGDLTLENDTD